MEDNATVAASDLSTYIGSALVVFLLIKWLTTSTPKAEDGFAGLEVIPGPKPFPLITWVGNIHQIGDINKTLQLILRFAEEFGDCVKVQGAYQTFVCFGNGPLAQALHKSSNMGHLGKSSFVYDNMKPFITNGVLVSTGKFWQTQRKTLMRTMSFQSLQGYMPLLNKHSSRIVETLGKLFADGKPHSINDSINASFMDVICEMLTGVDIHNTEEGIEYHHNFQTWKAGMLHRLLHPWLIPDILWNLHPVSKRFYKAIDSMSAFARRRIDEHKQQSLKQGLDNGDQVMFRSMLDELMDAGVSVEQTVDEVNTMLFGGHETTATTIHFFCFMMALHPEYQSLCQREVDELFEDPSQLSNGRLTFDSLSNLKYLERCINETLRLLPPVMVYVRSLDEPFTFDLKGQAVKLPKGTNVVVAPWLLHRNPEYYPNPTKYDPDRFLPEEVANRHPHAFIPFSAGPRNCIGLKFAMIEMKVVGAYIMRHFTLSTTDKLEDVPLLPHITLTPERDYVFTATKRH